MFKLVTRIYGYKDIKNNILPNNMRGKLKPFTQSNIKYTNFFFLGTHCSWNIEVVFLCIYGFCFLLMYLLWKQYDVDQRMKAGIILPFDRYFFALIWFLPIILCFWVTYHPNKKHIFFYTWGNIYIWQMYVKKVLNL